mgnify:CR=1 FL=1
MYAHAYAQAVRFAWKFLKRSANNVLSHPCSAIPHRHRNRIQMLVTRGQRLPNARQHFTVRVANVRRVGYRLVIRLVVNALLHVGVSTVSHVAYSFPSAFAMAARARIAAYIAAVCH